MKTILFFLLACSTSGLLAQNVAVDLFQKAGTSNTAQVGVRARAISGTVDYIGVTFYIMYQSANAAPQSTNMNSITGVDDSKMVTTFNWGSSSRFTNPAQIISPAFDPAPTGGQTYDSRYVYGNSDGSGGTYKQTLTTTWDTLLYVTLNTLQSIYPQGGYAYLQSTSDAGGAALTDPSFANISYVDSSGEVPLGFNTVSVSFSNFEANCTNNGTLVSWTTESESNSDYFELQHSTNGTDWTSVATIKAAGNSATTHTYQQLDQNEGAMYYRIKQVDLDGRFIYTNIIRTNCESNKMDMAIYPVPAQNILNVIIRSDKSLKTELFIVDGVGKIVRKIEANLTNGSNTFQFNLNGLSTGEYIIRSSANAIELNKKFNIIR